MKKIQVNLLNLSMLSKHRDALYSDASGQRSACGTLCLIKTICLPLTLVLGLAACAQSPIAVPKMQVPLMDVDVTSSLSGEIVKGSYITAYSNIALGLRQCWLGDKQPLQKAQFFARNKATGNDKKSDLFVHGPAVHPKRGPRIFSVHLKPRGTDTEVRMDNRLLDQLNEQRLTKDLRRWIKGEKGCLEHKSKNEITPAMLKQKKLEAEKRAAAQKAAKKAALKKTATKTPPKNEVLPWKK